MKVVNKIIIALLLMCGLTYSQGTDLNDEPQLTTYQDTDYLWIIDASDTTDDPGGSSKYTLLNTLRDWWFSSDNTISLGDGTAGTVVLTGNTTGTDATLTFGNGEVTVVGIVTADSLVTTGLNDFNSFTTSGVPNFLAGLTVSAGSVTLPAGSIDSDDILNDTVDSADYAAGSVDAEHLSADARKQFNEVLTGAGPHTISFVASTGEGYGSIHYIDQAATINVDAVVDGASFTVVTIGAIAVTVDVNAADQVRLNGSPFDAVGDGLTNSSTAGDMVTFTYYSADGWHATSDGNWTAQ